VRRVLDRGLLAGEPLEGGDELQGGDPRADLRFGTVPRLLDAAARRYGDAPALVAPSEHHGCHAGFVNVVTIGSPSTPRPRRDPDPSDGAHATTRADGPSSIVQPADAQLFGTPGSAASPRSDRRIVQPAGPELFGTPGSAASPRSDRRIVQPAGPELFGVTFAGLRDEAVRAAASFVELGVEQGDRVGLWAPNCTAWAILALGALGAGASLVPLGTRLTGAEVADVLRRARASVLLCAHGFLGGDQLGSLADEELPQLRTVVRIASPGRAVKQAAARVPLGATLLEQREFFEASGATARQRAARRWSAVGPTDCSDVIFTSGTTGRPKGVIATHAQSLRAFGTWAHLAGLRVGDRYLVVNPFSHTFGYKAGLLASLMAGATVVPEPVLDAEAVVERIERLGITVLPGPPALFQTLLMRSERARAALARLRLVVTGAAVVPIELVRALMDEIGVETVLTAYGLTESTGIVTMCRRGDDPDTVALTSGRPVPGVEVRVVDDAGRVLPAGVPGEVLVSGYTVTKGYLDDPEATRQAIDPDGWLRTGDIGVIDTRGNVTITDRKKDMFVVGGFNVYPAEVERVLAGHERVAEAAVIGVPDERLGEVGVAFVVVRPGGELASRGDDDNDDDAALARQLLEYAKARLANYKVPRRVEFVETLPRNASGKVLKAELRALLAASGKGQ
jgi:acyl-CoA synthetase (AMP-forming)/AMP-acid ligase II